MTSHREAEARQCVASGRSDFALPFSSSLPRTFFRAVKDGEDTPVHADTGRSSKRLQSMRENPLETLADVTLESASGACRIRCHRSVLCTYEYFRKAFGVESSFREADEKVLRFEDISSKALPLLVDYIYDRGDIACAEMSVALELWRLARIHFFGDLERDARTTVISGLEALLCEEDQGDAHVVEEGSAVLVDVLQEANCLGDAELVEACSRQFFTNYGRWKMSDMAKLLYPLAAEDMAAMQLFPAKKPGFEEEWATLVLEWVHHDLPSRNVYVADLMGDLALDNLSGSALSSLSERSSAFREARGSAEMTRIDDMILRSLAKKMRKLEVELDSISHCPEVGRASDLVRRDERDKRNRCTIV